MQHQGAPFGLRLLICFFISIFVPLGVQVIKYNHSVHEARGVTSLFIILVFWLLLFCVFEHLFLRIIGIKALPSTVFACTAYTLTPLMWFMWFFYAFNYYTSGSLVIADVLVAGNASASKFFLRVAPVLVWVALLSVLYIFSQSLRVLGELSPSGGFTSAIMSLVPFVLAFLLATVIVEKGRPGTVEYFRSIIESPKLIKTLT